jgi:hypothetical protein
MIQHYGQKNWGFQIGGITIPFMAKKFTKNNNRNTMKKQQNINGITIKTGSLKNNNSLFISIL